MLQRGDYICIFIWLKIWLPPCRHTQPTLAVFGIFLGRWWKSPVLWIWSFTFLLCVHKAIKTLKALVEPGLDSNYLFRWHCSFKWWGCCNVCQYPSKSWFGYVRLNWIYVLQSAPGPHSAYKLAWFDLDLAGCVISQYWKYSLLELHTVLIKYPCVLGLHPCY